MSLEPVSKNNHNKLAQAVQDAALLNMNEDIQEIHSYLEKIIKELPEEAKKQVQSLQENIGSLELALKAVPEQFDLDFSKKMNRILDTAMEIDSHSKQLKIDIDTHSKQLINALTTETPDTIVKSVVRSLNEKIDGYHAASTWTLALYGLLCTISGGVTTGIIFVLYVKFFL